MTVAYVAVVVAIAYVAVRGRWRRSRRFREACRRSARYRNLRRVRLAETRGHCEDCGDWHESAALHFHHTTPRAYGRESPRNMRLICQRCHSRRHHRVHA